MRPNTTISGRLRPEAAIMKVSTMGIATPCWMSAKPIEMRKRGTVALSGGQAQKYAQIELK